MSSAPRRIAAFDLGTNTFLALVAELDARGELRVVDDAFRTPRLGAGLARTGRIEAAALERGVGALSELLEVVERHGVTPQRRVAVGTAVFRRAANAAEFVALARERCGLSIDVVSGEVEGELSYAAAADAARAAGNDAHVTPLDYAVIDVGGGSTELAWDGGRQRISAAVGALVLTERHLPGAGEEAWPDAAWAAARHEVEGAFAAALGARRDAPAASVVVALGGSAANLASLEAEFAHFEPAATEGLAVSAAGAHAWAEQLRRLTREQRARFPLELSRAAILPAGLLCLGAALAASGAARARASGRGLRYGLAGKVLRGAWLR
jgi:exopolyphosphatase/guanosine-5'-triphosphate,3'-diphosphate pyrophosphatase